MDQSSLFRKSALDKLASPERLDVLMKVTSPMGWLALGTIGVVLVGVIAWSILAQIPERISGPGMLNRGEGSSRITAEGSGTLSELRVTVGQLIEPGDVVAMISVGVADAETVRLKENEVASAESGFRDLRATAESEKRSFRANIQLYEGQLQPLREQLQFEESREAERRDAVAQGRISQNQFQAYMNNLNSLRSQVNGLQVQITLAESEIRARDDRIANASRNVQQLQEQLRALRTGVESAAEVTSPFRGRVQSLPKREGDNVVPGDLIALVGESEAELRVQLFVSEADWSRLRADMPVEIDFGSTFRREEYGMLLGRVTSVGKAGATQDEIIRVMGSAQGAQDIMEMGPTRLVIVTLDENPENPTGFAWTSGRGPGVTLSAGVQVTGQVIAESRAPIEMVIPLFKSYLGG